MDLYFVVAVIDPTGQSWRSDLRLGGAGEAAAKKEVKKRDFYLSQFNLCNKTHKFIPFVIEAQGGVGETVLI